MRSDIIKKGIERIPHRALLHATALGMLCMTLVLIGCNMNESTIDGKDGKEKVVDFDIHEGATNVTRILTKYWPDVRHRALLCMKKCKYKNTSATYEEIAKKYAQTYYKNSKFIRWETSALHPGTTIINMVFSGTGIVTRKTPTFKIQWEVKDRKMSDEKLRDICDVEPRNFYAKEALEKFN